LGLSVVALVSALAATTAQAQVPPQIPYTGLLTYSNGSPYSGTVLVVATLHSHPTFDNAVFGPVEHENIAVQDGIVSFVLGGAQDPIPQAALLESELWLELEVNGNVLLPRQRILSVPYALRAQEASNAATLGGVAANLYAQKPSAQSQLQSVAFSGSFTDLAGVPNFAAQFVDEGQVDSISSAMLMSGAVDGDAIANGAVSFADWASNGCLEGQVPRFSGTAWQCADMSSTPGGGGGGSSSQGYLAKFGPSSALEDAAIYQTASGNLGIGTQTPSARLEVRGGASGAPAISAATSTIERGVAGAGEPLAGGVLYFSSTEPYFGVDPSPPYRLTNGETYGSLQYRRPGTSAGQWWLLFVQAGPTGGWQVHYGARFAIPAGTQGQVLTQSFSEALATVGSPTIPATGDFYIGWLSAAPGFAAPGGSMYADVASSGTVQWQQTSVAPVAGTVYTPTTFNNGTRVHLSVYPQGFVDTTAGHSLPLQGGVNWFDAATPYFGVEVRPEYRLAKGVTYEAVTYRKPSNNTGGRFWLLFVELGAANQFIVRYGARLRIPEGAVGQVVTQRLADAETQVGTPAPPGSGADWYVAWISAVPGSEPGGAFYGDSTQPGGGAVYVPTAQQPVAGGTYTVNQGGGRGMHIAVHEAGTTPNLELQHWRDGRGNVVASLSAEGLLRLGSANVGNSGGTRLVVHGQAFASGGFTSSSDARLKTQVETLTGALDALAALRGVRFEWTEAAQRVRGVGRGVEIGVLAQELEAVFPELVVTEPSGLKAVAYDKLVAVLVSALNEERAARVADVEALERRLNALEARLPPLPR
jgi:hypothetical protein